MQRSSPAAAHRPSPEETLRRAERLGHAIGPRHLAAPSPARGAIQRYFGTFDLDKAKGVPFSARISENLKIVASGPQTVYAADDKIDEANNILSKGSKIVLTAGKKKDMEMETAADAHGFHTVSFSDYYEVVPRYNPDAEKEVGDTAREASPEKGESREETEKKHSAYALEVKKVARDFAELQEETQRGAIDPKYAQKTGGVASTDPTEWYGATNGWCRGSDMRFLLLKLVLNDIAAWYMTHGSAKGRAQQLAQLGQSLQELLVAEISQPDRIALPTDCGIVVRSIVSGGKPVQDDRLAANPDIGSNYYTALPTNAANVGWNYHWAGVILKDGGDNVTLESAGGTSLGSIGKASWWMQMYGTRNVDQTFKKQIHVQHVLRNRRALAEQDQTPKVKKANEQLLEHRETVSNWTALDSDQG